MYAKARVDALEDGEVVEKELMVVSYRMFRRREFGHGSMAHATLY